MKSKTTAFWFVLAVALATAIWVLNNYFQPAAAAPQPLFAGLRPDQVTQIQIIPAGMREISVRRTNKVWRLEKPLVYPAQAAAIQGLLETLQTLTPILAISAGEMTTHKDADAEFGFANPQFTLDVAAGDQAWHVRVGYRTPPGDGVYVRVVGAPGTYITGTSWLQFLPHEVTEWRDTTLLDLPPLVDWLVITNGTQAIELRRDLTNRLWRMIRPLQARANNLLIVSALDQLRSASVSRFVSDDPKADLTAYGLEPAALDVWLGAGTNLLSAVHAGKGVTGQPGELYARREGYNTVVAAPKPPLALWQGAVNDFRDPNLVELTAPVAAIEVRGQNGFTLQQQGSNTWVEAGQKFPLNQEEVARFIRAVAGLRITDFVQDVVTASGLQSFGLTSPTREITLRSAVEDTNSIIAQLRFGSASTNEVYVKRADEDFVYGVGLEDFERVRLPGDYFRANRVWTFAETNVARVTLRQNGKTRQLLRNGTNDWSLAAGSQGIIDSPAVEEAVYRLTQLSVLAWIGRSFKDEEVGVGTNGLSVTLELKSGDKYAVEFGREELLPPQQTPTVLAVVTLDGERWAFVFPPLLCQLVAESLTIPASSP